MCKLRELRFLIKSRGPKYEINACGVGWGWICIPQLSLHLLQSEIPVGSGINRQSDIPLTIQFYWLPAACLPAWMIAPYCLCLPAYSPPNHFPADLIPHNCSPLLAWSIPSALPFCPDTSQLPSPAGLITPICLPLLACSPTTALPCWPSCGGHLVSIWGQPSCVLE